MVNQDILFKWLNEWHHKLIFLIIFIFLANRGVHRTVVGQKSAHIIIGQHHGSVGQLGTVRWRPVPYHGSLFLFDRGRTCLISIVIVHITILRQKGTVTWSYYESLCKITWRTLDLILGVLLVMCQIWHFSDTFNIMCDTFIYHLWALFLSADFRLIGTYPCCRHLVAIPDFSFLN